ncbi:YcjF family protein [Alkalilimnicola ehrlichii MLHE-1]|uniref:G domain-containing protein n=1 Tax=Alkalilimnicola ehrlichii (strain ATCC BAA-1101 / DSM 17681 / MLHE-1) TaxID=187272 RepID=Q0A890_ALKEH|nr:GTPase [Alkalilimnicola ehrlichii]ABI56947.1 conserved hypothetical protein [Alkalilimnicola ehrlichii MLHE-1]
MTGPRLARAWQRLIDAALRPERVGVDQAELARKAREAAPVLWLVGKVQSGKTSLVRALTGDPAATVGTGFQSCTRSARVYDFPPDAPLLRFLDSRGLGEADYDPAEDLAALSGQAHVVLAVARAMDLQQEAVLEPLRQVRRAHPDWPVLLVQTCLHEGYPAGRDHPPYPALDRTPGLEDLQRCRYEQARAFQALPGRGPVAVVAVDFTPAEEGFDPPLYGLEALLDALEALAPEGLAAILADLRRPDDDPRVHRARPHILSYASAAAAGDAVPLLGLVSVPVLQGKLLHSLGRIYGVPWDRRSLGAFLAALGSGTLAGLGLGHGARQLGKLVPGYGQTVGAAAAAATSFAVTYALGHAACHYLARAEAGRDPTAGVEQAYREALRDAFGLVRRRAVASAPGTGEGP